MAKIRYKLPDKIEIEYDLTEFEAELISGSFAGKLIDECGDVTKPEDLDEMIDAAIESVFHDSMFELIENEEKNEEEE